MATQAQPVGRKVPWYRYPGWWAAVTGGFHGFVTFSIILYGWSVFAAAFRKEFGWSAAALGATASVLRVVQIPASIGGGWLTDKIGPRYASIISCVIVALGWVLIAQTGAIALPEVAGIPPTLLWVIIAYSVVLGLGYNGGNYRQSYPAVNRFFERRRTLGLGIIATMAGIGSTILVPSLGFAIEAYGWRTVALFIGIVPFLILYTITSFGFVTHPPEHYGLLRDNMTPEEVARQRATRAVAQPKRGAMEGFTEKEILLSPAFWLIITGVTTGALGGAALTVFQNLRLQEVGYSLTEAATLYGIQFVFQVIGRAGIGLIGDRLVAAVPVRIIYAACYVLLAIGILAFAFASVQPVLLVWVWIVVYGFGLGTLVPLGGVIIGEYFGRASFGFAYGARIGLSGFGGFISPLLLGWIRDISGDWILAFLVATVGYAIAAVALAFAAPPKAPTTAAQAQTA